MKKLLQKYGRIGAAGLSLVELIISMAILAVVGTAVGGAMYISSKNYVSGSAEINVQEEAQIASNLICDWIVDATKVTPGNSTVDLSAGDTLEIVHPDGDSEVTITISLGAGNVLQYDALKKTANASDPAHPIETSYSGVLANNVTGAVFDSTFDTNRNVHFSVDFKLNERTYHTVTDSTSRNHDFISSSSVSVTGNPTIKFNLPYDPSTDEYILYLEPGQNVANNSAFTFTASVFGCNPDSGSYSFGIANGPGTDTSLSTPTRIPGTNQYNIVASSNNNATAGFSYKFELSDAGRSTYEYVHISIRRANECKFDTHEALLESGDAGKNGAVYKVKTFNVGSQCYPKMMGSTFDSGLYAYKDASRVEYYYRFADGTDASAYVSAVEVKSMYEVPGSPAQPSVKVTLTQDISSDIYVIAVAVHTGNISPSSSNYMVGSSKADNKVTAINLASDSTYAGFGYYGTEAKWDYFKIAKGSDIIVRAGEGLRRGTPACMAAEWGSNAKDDLSGYISDGINSTLGISYSASAVEDNTTHGGVSKPVTYYTVLKYRKSGTTDPYQQIVLHYVNDYDSLFSDYASRRVRDSISSIFRLDTAYDIVFELDVLFKGTKVYSTSADGHVPAGQIYYYVPDSRTDAYDHYFLTNEYDTVDHSFVIEKTPNPYYTAEKIYQNYDFPIYIDGVNQNASSGFERVEYIIQKETTDDHGNTSWVDCTSSVQRNNPGSDWSEGVWNGSESLGFNDAFGNYITHVKTADGRQQPISSYKENPYPDYGVNLEYVTIKGSALEDDTNYRIVFTTDYVEADSITPGTIGSGTAGLGSVNSTTRRYYNLYDTAAGIDNSRYGVIYFKTVNPPDTEH